MRATIALAVTCVLAMASPSEAQLRLTNSNEETIVIKFLPTALRPGKMREEEIPPTQQNDPPVTIQLTGDDPFDVSFHLKGEDNQEGFQAKVGRPIPLRQLAASGAVFDIGAAQGAKQVRGRTLHQTMSMTLTGTNGEGVEVFGEPQDASEFVQGVVNSRWQSRYQAISGSLKDATVDFTNLRYGQQGRFTDLLISEDDQECYICARWSFGQQSRGDVFFRISKNDPNRLRGDYLVDGNPTKRFSWTGSR